MAYLLSDKLYQKLLGVIDWIDKRRIKEQVQQLDPRFIGTEITLARVQEDPSGTTLKVKFVRKNGTDDEEYGTEFDVKAFSYGTTDLKACFPTVLEGDVIPIGIIGNEWYSIYWWQKKKECE